MQLEYTVLMPIEQFAKEDFDSRNEWRGQDTAQPAEWEITV